MSSPNLLQTNTVSFQDLIGNGKSYQVPLFQRDYSWKEEQWEDLWQDVLDLQPNPSDRHYMGAVVVKAETDRLFSIIDGQQRIATLTILGLAVIACLRDLDSDQDANQERAEALRARFVGEKDPASLTETSKLTLNENDNGFFQDYLVNLKLPFNPRSLKKSNRLLYECFGYFRRQIVGLPQYKDGKVLAELLSEVVARRLAFILITVDDELRAYTVFETLNARGLELTTADLLKNYLFSRLATDTDRVAIQRRWNRIVSTVRQERFGEFLRYHYLTIERKVRSERLFKVVRDAVKTPSEVFDLLDSLGRRSELYAALGDHTDSLWVDRTAREYVRQLNLFRVRQVTPLLFAAYEQFSSENFVKVLRMTTVISFRYTVVSGLNTNELEPIYSDAAKAILEGRADTPQKVFAILRPLYVIDDKFVSDFQQLSINSLGPRAKLAKYILCCLEGRLSGKEQNSETDPGTVEHILPENPDDSWSEMIPADRWDECINRLGNLTLLRGKANWRLGSVSYEEKVPEYRKSEYQITREIPEAYPNEWTISNLEARQEDLATRAKSVWRVDFD
jgi:uncharacterized protein DUF262/uncharacterized protein DUF1524